jgi:hypothetical protein
MRSHSAAFAFFLLMSCDGIVVATDASTADAAVGGKDASTDAGSQDAGAPDANVLEIDSGTMDSGADASVIDAGFIDAGTDAGTVDAAVVDSGFAVDAGRDAGIDAGHDAGVGYCTGQKLCENFESYTAATLTNGTNIGPWRTIVEAGNGAVSIDSSKSFSGNRSLKIHINQSTTGGGGGQLRTKSNAVFSPTRQRLYGKFRLFLATGAGTSNHWTMFGAAGIVPAGVPIATHHVTYLYSAFNGNNQNRFGNVFYDDQTAQDCWHHSTSFVPTGRWACAAFSVDGPQIQYRFFLDGAPVPSMSVNTTGDGCLNAAATAPWYGPNFDEFYIGALSFHPMSAALDMWVDDVVLDVNPVSCE